ncbi:Fe2+-dependent dioxygenase [Altererythrobacter sp. ZODW24]|uniref:Fe2+-dependent dioxygenase n=1 Tax=Altererythrobacter sp. ZODW24 TaxID=2185142 RepID=UPI000DF77A0A|nr:Fe2+-dependent dioxygenase [Altererythrobacter sp. ZODW24]
MILNIPVIEDAAQLQVVQDLIPGLTWQDGSNTAGKVAQAVKRNEQAVLNDSQGQAMRQAILPLIVDNPVLLSAARPRRFSHFTVSKTKDGGFYGPHIDNSLMGQGEGRMRSDLSFTLFLTPPEEYDGGELAVHSASVTQSVKAAAGQLVLYPSSSIHEVTPVTRGERVVCIGWIESLIADPARRELLFDLESTRNSLRNSLPDAASELLRLDKTIANLSRMWSVL